MGRSSLNQPPVSRWFWLKACLHIPSPSPCPSPSLSKYNIVPMVMVRLMGRMGTEPILSLKWSVSIDIMINFEVTEMGTKTEMVCVNRPWSVETWKSIGFVSQSLILGVLHNPLIALTNYLFTFWLQGRIAADRERYKLYVRVAS